MSMIVTYFVHGTTTDNESGIATGWLPGELSSLGIRQSKELAELTRDREFDAVFCSDLQRAVDSAGLAFADRYVVTSDTRLREINYGDWNGQPEHFKQQLTQYVDHPFPNGECYRDVETRVMDFLVAMKRAYADRHIAVVAHQAPQLALEVLCNGKTWEQAIVTDWRRAGAWQPGWEYTW